MDIIRFALGIRLETASACGALDVPAALSRLLCCVPKKRFAGMKLYAGRCPLDEYDEPDILTVVVMGEGMKKTKALYDAVKKSPALMNMLSEYRPVIQSNTVARLEGLTYYGEFDKKGELSGGDACFEPVEPALKKDTSEDSEKPVFVLAPDKFKGTLKQSEVIGIFKSAARSVFPLCSFVSVPMADGGEGTGRIIAKAMGARLRTASVTNAYGENITAEFHSVHPDTAVVEMASASGLAAIKCELDPMRATSFGTGELMLKALDEGAKRLCICLGGSATNDGGIGAASALGVRFLDAAGTELEAVSENLGKIAQIDASGMDARLKQCDITALCDVNNPLCGEHGATYTFGAQKGADDEKLEALEAGMRNLEGLYNALAGYKVCSREGAGAAGGMGAMLACLMGARLEAGAEAVLKLQRFDERLLKSKREANGKRVLLVTGEGRLDGTSFSGKTVGAVVRHAHALGIPSLVIAGSLGDGWERLSSLSPEAAAFASGGSCEDGVDMKNAAKKLEKAARDAFRSIKSFSGK